MNKLPEADFCGTKISRLIIGGNPFSGNSHQNSSLDAEMENFYTAEKIKEVLRRCYENGITTAQLRGDRHIARVLREYRLEGGIINWIGQTAPEMYPYENNVRYIKNNGAFCLYHHGSVTDNLFLKGEYEEIKRRLKVIRESGMKVGLGSHMPEVFEYSEKNKWDVDFYMCCVYNISKLARESSSVTGRANGEEPFDEGDRSLMFDFIASTDKPCLAFKILGAGRRCTNKDDLKSAFSESFKRIKKNDAVIVGMYPKDSDQIKENTEIVRQILL